MRNWIRHFLQILFLVCYGCTTLFGQATEVPTDEQITNTRIKLIISAIIFVLVTGYTIFKVVTTYRKK